MKSLITVELPIHRITFCPDREPAVFPVVVGNQSQGMAQFRLEVVAAGADPDSQIDWCQPSPEISAAIPSGDQTTFNVTVFNSPIPHFVGNIHLSIKISSPDISGEVRRQVTLTVEPGADQPLFNLCLQPPLLQAYPGNPIEIPVQVCNLTHEPLEIHLRLSGLPDRWLHVAERRQRLRPQQTVEVMFQGQLPTVKQALSQNYPFRVDAFSHEQTVGQVEGTLQVLPIGFIKFAVTPQQQSLPACWRDWNSRTAQFQAAFENVSNLVQWVTVALKGRDYQRCRFDPPEATELGLAAFSQMPFAVTVDRPWLGWAKTLHLEAIAESRSFDSVDIEPPVQPIQLRVLPMVPLWLLAALLALLAAILALLLQPPPIGHTDFVNAVRFSSDGLSAVSGSDDCTIRRWKIEGQKFEGQKFEGQNLQPEGQLTDPPAVTCNNEPLQPSGVLTFTNQTVFSLAFLPELNNRVAAGLANGSIQIWDLPTRQQIAQLRDPDDQTEDRVFDLAFTRDARTLFSGHGSGKIRVWQRQPGASFSRLSQILTLSETRQTAVKYQVRAIALSPDDQILASAGSKNTLALWNWTAEKPTPMLLLPQSQEEDYVWDVAFSPDAATLATSDSRGFITLWDLQQCPIKPDTNPTDESLTCPWRRWRAVQQPGNIAVRSLHFSADSRYLVSASDEGKVMLWDISEVKQVAESATVRLSGKRLTTSSEKISSVDLLNTDREILVLSGGDDRKVRLERIDVVK